ncbi:hypothetical protein JK386_00570 [Nocardioides sp. zg-536]|uniref:Ig-like domain-containing protein n=1 Tax=Nocardioides faecalis TaxID=2803858 RepID=A0A938Y3D0_9ACTN|nr:hypothetical protein [Nocardioides faecalis]MBM9458392.1 hypothetical protein [Nocardioides faecalis]QVI58411.1 hypothetical protein KG111_15650 [Nocardioides faecalis]
MKKLVISLLAAVLMTLGLAGVSGTASAAPYPGTVPVSKPAPVKKAVRPGGYTKFSIATKGNAKPVGTARVTCRKGDKVAKRVWSFDGTNTRFNGPKLKSKGKWRCKIHFTGVGVFKNSKSVVYVRVR